MRWMRWRALSARPYGQVIVFCNTRKMCENTAVALAKKLRNVGRASSSSKARSQLTVCSSRISTHPPPPPLHLSVPIQARYQLTVCSSCTCTASAQHETFWSLKLLKVCQLSSSIIEVA